METPYSFGVRISEQEEVRIPENELWLAVVERIFRDLASLATEESAQVQTARDVLCLREYILTFIMPSAGISEGSAVRLWELMETQARGVLDGDSRAINRKLKHARMGR